MLMSSGEPERPIRIDRLLSDGADQSMAAWMGSETVMGMQERWHAGGFGDVQLWHEKPKAFGAAADEAVVGSEVHRLIEAMASFAPTETMALEHRENRDFDAGMLAVSAGTQHLDKVSEFMPLR